MTARHTLLPAQIDLDVEQVSARCTWPITDDPSGPACDEPAEFALFALDPDDGLIADVECFRHIGQVIECAVVTYPTRCLEVLQTITDASVWGVAREQYARLAEAAPVASLA